MVEALDKGGGNMEEEFFRKFDDSLGYDHNEKMIQGLIEDNEELLNGRYGKRQETLLHRYHILNNHS